MADHETNAADMRTSQRWSLRTFLAVTGGEALGFTALSAWAWSLMDHGHYVAGYLLFSIACLSLAWAGALALLQSNGRFWKHAGIIIFVGLVVILQQFLMTIVQDGENQHYSEVMNKITESNVRLISEQRKHKEETPSSSKADHAATHKRKSSLIHFADIQAKVSPDFLITATLNAKNLAHDTLEVRAFYDITLRSLNGKDPDDLIEQLWKEIVQNMKHATPRMMVANTPLSTELALQVNDEAMKQLKDKKAALFIMTTAEYHDEAGNIVSRDLCAYTYDLANFTYCAKHN